MKTKLIYAVAICVIALSGCSVPTGPSVLQKPGANLQLARTALKVCSAKGPQGARNALTSHYIGSVFWGGLVVGPIIVASSSGRIQQSGAYNAVDGCLEDRGYLRRDLTAEEVRALQVNDRFIRELILDHLVAGGTLETLRLNPDYLYK